SYYENGTVFDEGLPYAKRPLGNPWSSHHHQHAPNHQYHHNAHHQPTQQQLPHQQHHPGDIPYCWYSTPNQHPHSIIPSLMQPGYPGAPLPHQQPAIAHTATSAGAPAGHQPSSLAQNGSSSLEDEWKNIHVMLNCILGMVDKTKRALAILQKRGCTSPASSSSSSSTANGGNHQATNGGGPAPSNGSLDCGEGTFKRLSGEIVAQTIRATEDRVAEVKRRAEEAVQEVKRAAVAEVQRAVAAAMAESRANERLRGQRYLEGPQQPRTGQKHGRPGPFLRLADARTAPGAPTTTTGDEPDKDAHHSGAVATGCWNCGRQALETCGGCGVARYCGSFCQHRDWEAGGHHATCSSTKANGPAAGQQQQQDRARSSTPSPPRAASAASDSDPASNKPTSTIRVTK
ncbi:protein CBFA2T3, partial [Copidosoma floridanum]|uniref:protein CBFA2T3 n=1 Tax=Copidosoma floridanum TaxID=29053 RepID=UPI0006C958C8